MISPVGGPAAAPIQSELAELGGRQAWIEVASPTRVCTTLLDESTGETTELVEEAAPLSAAEIARFESLCAEHLAAARVAVFTGSIPAGTPPDIYARLLAKTEASAILDIRGPELELALACRPLVVKPNRHELEGIVGRKIDGDAELCEAMARLNETGARVGGRLQRPARRLGARRPAGVSRAAADDRGGQPDRLGRLPGGGDGLAD